MTDQLPIISSEKNISTIKSSSTTLLGRGLAAIKSQSLQLNLVEIPDEIYRQARDIFNRITGYGDQVCVAGDSWNDEELAELYDCLDKLNRLVNIDYGKAFFLLWNLYRGGAKAHRNEILAETFGQKAFDWCFDNQFENDPEIWNDLGTLYRLGIGCEVDEELAMYWFRQSADVGNAEGMFNVSGMYEFGVGVEEDLETAHYWQVMAAEAGHAYAQYGLACQYHHGGLYEQDDEFAFYWYLQAAVNGYDRAKHGVQELSCYRFRLPKDNGAALSWFRKQGYGENVWAQLFLANAYYCGLGIECDKAVAMDWYFRAANLGSVEAQNRIGEIFELGNDVVDQDYDEAVDWFRMGAEQGFSDAQVNLGWMFEVGNGVSQDSNEAAFWYRQAAEQGNAEAKCMLGALYQDGPDFEQDLSLALFWFSEAANQGEAYAQFNLGEMYELGKGVDQSKETAISWYLKSAQNGHDRSQKRLSELGITF
ncbi:MAG: SEL1-like repeat protein [Methylococcales bacterium]|nr:SEL1-like repeat protein [Methylococcaceae bacterium]